MAAHPHQAQAIRPHSIRPPISLRHPAQSSPRGLRGQSPHAEDAGPADQGHRRQAAPLPAAQAMVEMPYPGEHRQKGSPKVQIPGGNGGEIGAVGQYKLAEVCQPEGRGGVWSILHQPFPSPTPGAVIHTNGKHTTTRYTHTPGWGQPPRVSPQPTSHMLTNSGEGAKRGWHAQLGVPFPHKAPDVHEEDIRAVKPPRQNQWESVPPLGPSGGVPGVAPGHAGGRPAAIRGTRRHTLVAVTARSGGWPP